MLVNFNQNIAKRAGIRGAERLSNILKPDGQFIYHYVEEGFFLKEEFELRQEYTGTRHLLCCWTLFDVSALEKTSKKFHDAALRAFSSGTALFVKRYLNTDQFAIVDHQNAFMLGATGLYLAAASLMDSSKLTDELDVITEGMGKFIINQLTESGDFVHARKFPEGEMLDHVSPFSTGQALLGLFSLSKITSNNKWADVALDSISRLNLADYGVSTRSHWMLYALNEALDFSHDKNIMDYGSRIASVICQDRENDNEKSSAYLSCRSEALVSWLRMYEKMPITSDIKNKENEVRRAVKRLLRKLLQLQCEDGGFSMSNNERVVRIDNIAHATLALIQYSRLKTIV